MCSKWFAPRDNYLIGILYLGTNTAKPVQLFLLICRKGRSHLGEPVSCRDRTVFGRHFRAVPSVSLTPAACGCMLNCGSSCTLLLFINRPIPKNKVKTTYVNGLGK